MMATKGKTAKAAAVATDEVKAPARKPRAKPKTVVVKAKAEPKKRTGERKEPTAERLRAMVAGQTLEIRKTPERAVSTVLANLKRSGAVTGRFVVRSTTRGVAVWRVE